MESPRNLPQPGPARDVHDRDTLRATPQSPPATESVSIQQAETVPTTIPAAQKVDDEDEDEEDGDAEEWDGDSIYDGYRYSRISMVSKRASRFTTASDKMPAFGAGAQFGSMASMGSTSTVGSGPGFGSPELPARARAVSERSGSPRSVGIGGKRSGESSPASPNFPGRRAATPNSPSSPLGPGLAAHAARVGASPIPVQMRDDVPTFNNLTTNSPRVGTPNNTTNARWTPSPILPLTPTRRVDFGSQQVVKPVHPHAASPVPAMSPSQATSPSGDEEPTPTKTTRPPSHLAVTPRPHPPIQPVENPFARPRAHEKELSSDRGSVITLAREGLDLQAVQSNAGLDMIAEVHISPDK
ncbi:hypothetical protein BKA62DRAFT_412001 [Auriculariales sp. MPI-PUGE-AT-0066]|nr:hypothetical protein BKA62DRAFT_412001 [Auriculariales sp. MPI-PUGE-AT-0066]